MRIVLHVHPINRSLVLCSELKAGWTAIATGATSHTGSHSHPVSGNFHSGVSHGWPDDQETDLSTERFGTGVTEELLEEFDMECVEQN